MCEFVFKYNKPSTNAELRFKRCIDGLFFYICLLKLFAEK